MRRVLFLLVCVLVAFPALAVVMRSDGTVTIARGQTITDDLVVTGGTINIEGNIDGDLVVAGGTVTMTGSTRGSVMVAGGDVTINGPVGGSVYAAGGTVRVASSLTRNLVIAGSTVTVERGATIGRDLAVSGGNVTVAGAVRRNLRGSMKNLVLTDTARVGGNLNVVTSNPKIASGAVISGERNIREPEQRKEHRPGWLGLLFWQFFMALGLLLAGIIFLALAPVLTAQAVGVIRVHPWASLLAGLVILVVVPIAIILLFVTIIGIPLGFILSWVYLTAVYISPIFPALLIGYLILRRPTANRYLALLIGIAILFVIRLIPFLGFLVTLIAVLIGLGALFFALQGRTRHPMYPPPSAPPTSA